ncbi:MAG TPA: hypothetical protein VFC61_10350 [Blastocatellia bacterium]|nr:hypothetical protein [Blastocatellia bacterium]
MTVRKVIFALVLATMTAIPTIIARAQSGEPEHAAAQALAESGVVDVLEHVKQAQAQQLEGSWVVTVTPAVPPGVPQPPSFRAYGSFSRGGATFGSDRRRPTSKQHGTWAHLGGNQFAWTAIEDLFDGMGNFTGSVTIRVRITVTGKDEFVGVSNGEERDAFGNVTFSRCGTIRGERIKIEPLAPQCQ